MNVPSLPERTTLISYTFKRVYNQVLKNSDEVRLHPQSERPRDAPPKGAKNQVFELDEMPDSLKCRDRFLLDTGLSLSYSPSEEKPNSYHLNLLSLPTGSLGRQLLYLHTQALHEGLLSNAVSGMKLEQWNLYQPGQ